MQMAIIGVDWGSTSFRAYRYVQQSGDSVVTETRDANGGGIKAHNTERFEPFLLEQIGDWLDDDGANLVYLSGMITSRNGWHETPYVDCPAKLTELAGHCVQVQREYADLRFLPGLCQQSPGADVIRGEELQLLGACHLDSEDNTTQLVIMPGTHSKWSRLDGQSVTGFHTAITGELYDLLLNQSLIGQLAKDPVDQNKATRDTATRDIATRDLATQNPAAPADNGHDAIFEEGVSTAFHNSRILSLLFSCRAAVLLEKIRPEQVQSWLSGLLIGTEIREGMSSLSGYSPGDNAAKRPAEQLPEMLLIGSESLCKRYQRAFSVLQLPEPVPVKNATIEGYRRLFSLNQ